MTAPAASSTSRDDQPRQDSVWLVECFRSGDECAAEALFARYFARLTALVRARLSVRLQARIDADDVAQSTYRSFFVRASSGQFDIRENGDLWRLLACMALHKLSHQVGRHAATKRAVSVEEPLSESNEIVSLEPSPEEAAAVADELEFVMRALSETERRTLELRLQGELLEAIAVQLGQSERTVRRTLARVREIMLTRLPEVVSGNRTQQPELGRMNAVAAFDYADFQLKQQLGAGLTGKVYRAWWKSRGCEVAVKYLRREHQRYSERVERFCAEVALVSGLSLHPNIAAVHGLGRAPHGGYFIVLDWINGPDLQMLLNQSRDASKALAVEDISRWMADAARAIQHAHESGLIHCDLKPSNLLLAPDGRVVLTDFGFARRLTSNESHSIDGGTLAFMAPEQLDGSLGTIGPQVDVFGWGAVLHALLTGVAPRAVTGIADLMDLFRSRYPTDLLQSHHESDIKRLCSVCALCLNPDPAARPATMLDVLALLEQT